MATYVHENIIDDADLHVKFVLSDEKNGFYPAHWHSHIEIILITDGTMTAYINSSRYTLHKGDMLLVNANDIHSTQMHGTTKYILLQIPPEFIRRSLHGSDFLHFQEYFPDSDENYFQMKESLYAMKDDFIDKPDGFQLHFSSMIYFFLYNLYKDFRSELSSGKKLKNERDIKRIEQVIRYIRINYHEQITLSKASASVALSREYFCRLFHEYTGQTFLQYLGAYRMVQFYGDLIRTDESITFLLEKNGITNYKSFMKLFKSTYHLTPGQVRMQLKQNT